MHTGAESISLITQSELWQKTKQNISQAILAQKSMVPTFSAWLSVTLLLKKPYNKYEKYLLATGMMQ